MDGSRVAWYTLPTERTAPETASREAAFAFVDALKLFSIGYSWGGVHSLAPPHGDITRDHGRAQRRSAYGDRLVRLNIGLEDPEDLVADLKQALKSAGLPRSRPD